MTLVRPELLLRAVWAVKDELGRLIKILIDAEVRAGFLLGLETVDGVPAEPRELTSAVPNWSVGDTIHLGKRTLDQ